MKIILYSQVLLFFFRKGGKILLPPRAEAYVPTPEASDKGLRVGFIFLPHGAVCTVRLILFHLIVHRHNSPYNQGRLFARPQVRASLPSARTPRKYRRDTSLIHQTQSPYYSSFPLNLFKEYILMKFPSAVSPRAAGNAQLLPVPFMLTTRQYIARASETTVTAASIIFNVFVFISC